MPHYVECRHNEEMTATIIDENLIDYLITIWLYNLLYRKKRKYIITKQFIFISTYPWKIRLWNLNTDKKPVAQKYLPHLGLIVAQNGHKNEFRFKFPVIEGFVELLNISLFLIKLSLTLSKIEISFDRFLYST